MVRRSAVKVEKREAGKQECVEVSSRKKKETRNDCDHEDGGLDKTRQDRTRQDKTRQDKTRQDKTR